MEIHWETMFFKLQQGLTLKRELQKTSDFEA